MKYQPTRLLKLALILIGLSVLVLLSLINFEVGAIAFREAAKGAVLGYIVLAVLTLVTTTLLPFYAALNQAYRLLTYIDQKQAFSKASVIALNKIKQAAFVITGIYILMLPFVYILAEWDDAPGLIIVGMVPAFASFVVAVFSAVLKQVFEEAFVIHTENALTI